MLIALYEFKVKEGMNAQFEENWALFTDAIYRCRGSLGSRLHTTKTKDTYVAYAQWPSEDVYFSDGPGADPDSYSEDDLIAREKMRESIAESKVLHLMDVLDDRLK
jgi:hypothetical protein